MLKIIELNKRDQFLRIQDPTYTFLKDSTFKEDDKIMKEIIPIIAKNGYPNEYKVGIFLWSDTLLKNNGSIDIIILHNYCKLDNYKTDLYFNQNNDLVSTSCDLLYIHKPELNHPPIIKTTDDDKICRTTSTGRWWMLA